MERIADIGFARHVRWTHLVDTERSGCTSAVPTPSVTPTRTPGRWDPTDDSVVVVPRILLGGGRQRAALLELRRALDLPLEERAGATEPTG